MFVVLALCNVGQAERDAADPPTLSESRDPNPEVKYVYGADGGKDKELKVEEEKGKPGKWVVTPKDGLADKEFQKKIPGSKGVHSRSKESLGMFDIKEEKLAEGELPPKGTEGVLKGAIDVTMKQNMLKDEVAHTLMPASTLLAKQIEDWKFILKHAVERYTSMMQKTHQALDAERKFRALKEQERLTPVDDVTKDIVATMAVVTDGAKDDDDKHGIPKVPEDLQKMAKDGAVHMTEYDQIAKDTGGANGEAHGLHEGFNLKAKGAGSR